MEEFEKFVSELKDLTSIAHQALDKTMHSIDIVSIWQAIGRPE